MPALQPPAFVQQGSASEQQDVIEVVGRRADQVLKIDRRTYRVQQNPHSAQKDAIQLLRGLPAVTISPGDQVYLLGTPSVKILIDGRASRTDLHTLHGTDIERIEIITNPSAQYSAVGTAGIINLVLRKKQGQGVSGNSAVEGSSLGRASGDATIKSKHGKWTYEFGAQGNGGESRHSTYRKKRSIEAVPGASPTVDAERGGGPQRTRGVSLRAKVSYELDSKTTLSAELSAGAVRSTSTNHAQFVGITPDFQSFSERQENVDAFSTLGGIFTLGHKGPTEGETLNASIVVFGNPYHRNESAADLSNGSSLSSETRERSLSAYNKIDWEHPIGKKQVLSVGAEWDLQEIGNHYRFNSSDERSFGPDTFDKFRGRESTIAAYMTFQQQIGSWAIMPGLRVERNARHIFSPGQSDVDIDRTDLFPTFHVEHPLSKVLDLTLSYSKRIDRPRFDMLRPYPVVADALTVAQGDPDLRDQSIDSYEINLQYHRKKMVAGMILYDRETSQAWNTSYFVNAAGQNVYTWVNAGRQRNSGVEFDVNTPIINRVKAMASVNLFDSRVPVDVVGGNMTDQRFRFTSNATVEWDGPDLGGKPGDIAQLSWQHESPQRAFQFKSFAWNRLIFSYTHSFSKTVSLTATADSGALHQGHLLLAPLVQENYAVHNRGEFKLKLLKTFGEP